MSGAIEIGGTLPEGGQRFDAVIAHDVISVRVGDRTCVAHARWMTNEQALQVAEQLTHLVTRPGDAPC